MRARAVLLSSALAICCRVAPPPERVEASRAVVPATLSEGEPEEGVWVATGTPLEALTYRAAVLLDDGRVLTVGGENAESPSRSAELWSPKTGQWSAGPPTEEARHYPLLVKTENGQVLVIDKKPPLRFPPTARKIEAWDAGASAWRTVATVTSSRMITAAIPVRPHKVVVVDELGATQLLDLATGAWTAVGGAEGESLPHGYLVVSAARDTMMAIAKAGFDTWLWTPHTVRWTAVASPPLFTHKFPEDLRLVETEAQDVLAAQPSAKRAAFWGTHDRAWREINLREDVYEATRNLFALADGRVLACQQYGSTAWALTPRTGVATRAASLPYKFSEGAVVPFVDGGALLLTGRSAETWRPRGKAEGRFLAANQTVTGQCCAGVAALSDGARIMVAVGSKVGSAIWDPRLAVWSPAAGAVQDHDQGAAIGLRDGRVMLAGGLDRTKSYGALCRPGPRDRVLSSTELWDPKTGEWSSGGTLNQRQSQLTLLQLNNDRVLALHGEICTLETSTGCLSEFCRASATGELWDPARNRWATIAPYAIYRPADIGAAVLADGRVLVVGGSYTDLRAETWDPSTGRWSMTAPMSSMRISAQLTALPDGRALVTGGGTSPTGASLRSAELFDPRTNQWVLTSPMQSARRGHSAVLLADGRVLVAGGVPGEEVARAEVWNPADGQWSAAGNVRAEDPRGRLFALGDGSAAFVPVREPIEVWRPSR